MDNLLIGDFEGPLDLLLHLIKKSKMEIFDIEISEITKEYLNYIKEMTDMNLDIASEYLVMAAELIEMKSRKLLPNKKDEEEKEEDENPEEELKRRLIEYKKYKESTEVFRNLEENRANYYTKAPESLKQYSSEKLENDGSVGIFDLLDAFQKLLERQEYNKPKNTKITRKELSVKERVAKIRDILKVHKKINFIELFDNFSKPYVVVTFLSVLEMAKNREINIKQDNNFSDIYLERVD
ncbi:MAG: segregation/condensation protein A [Bacilli bacterium]|nr:segregation/condensation protein A [Mollicutes bacterium]MDY6072026.1 segregation/condensation protein A [Bacilli bacterium]